MKKFIMISDHAGFKLKEDIKTYLQEKGYDYVDLGPKNDLKSISYALQGMKLSKYLIENKLNNYLGIGICGTGIGISFALNRFKGIRAARITTIKDAKMAKKHNNANVLVFGGKQLNEKKAFRILDEFLKNKFEKGRHLTRIEDLDK